MLAALALLAFAGLVMTYFTVTGVTTPHGHADCSDTVTGVVVHVPHDQTDATRLVTATGATYRLPTSANAHAGQLATFSPRTTTFTPHSIKQRPGHGATALFGAKAHGNRSLVMVRTTPHGTSLTIPHTHLRDHATTLAQYYRDASAGALNINLANITEQQVASHITCATIDELMFTTLKNLGVTDVFTYLKNHHVVAYLPSQPGEPAGKGYIGLNFSCVTSGNVNTLIHEVGHNLGLAHASAVRCPPGVDVSVQLAGAHSTTGCRVSEYGNILEMMSGRTPVRSMTMGAAFLHYLSWGVARHRTISPGTTELPPLSSAAHVRYLTFWDEPSHTTYFVSYRSADVGGDRDFFAATSKWHTPITPGIVITGVHADAPERSVLVLPPGDRHGQVTMRAGDHRQLADGRLTVRVLRLEPHSATLSFDVASSPASQSTTPKVSENVPSTPTLGAVESTKPAKQAAVVWRISPPETP